MFLRRYERRKNGKTVRIRYVTTPDKAQRVLLNRSGLTLPQRLKYMEDALPM